YEMSLVAATGETVSEIEPISRFYEIFNASLDAAHAAASLGLQTGSFLQKIQENTNLQSLGLGVLETGEIKRDTWTSNFKAVVFALNTPTIVEEPDPVIPIAPPSRDIASDPDNVVYIPDPNLRKALSRILVKSADEPITIQEMQGLGHLGDELADQGIRDLTGLEYATNLTVLGFEINEVSDLSPIAGLINLVILYFPHNNVSDLSPLAGLTELRTLDIAVNPLSDLSPLAEMTELENIIITGLQEDDKGFLKPNSITDFSVLAGKEKLRNVRIWDAPVKDMSLFVNPNIEVIDLCGAGISEIPSLENAPKLRELYLLNNHISDVSVLQNLTGLERLLLAENNITDVSPLANLTNLKWLNIRDNPITDYSVLDELWKNTKIEPNGFVFSANAERVGLGNPFTFDINAQFIRNLVGWQCNITFDADLLEVVEVTEGNFLSQDGSATLFQEGTIDNEAGIISGYNVLRLDGTSVNGSGTLLSIKFRAKRIGTAVFTPGNCLLADSEGEEIPSEALRLEIEIKERAPLPEDEIWTGPKEDVNRDGVINILDLVLVSKNVGKPVNEAPRADINGDGVINILDLIAVAGNLDG
ncbi:MAG: leucine-rich repeat domain-containing protein, partial [Candidatus Poribacteria bacterium]|nr:leucine-rich repeat domain-containing protein [Candidatus Poribacteria bacterium]